MVKIKRKVQKNLPQLIEWAWDNGIDSRTFIDPEGGDITFDEYGEIVDVHSINHHDTFTVEVEEEITEDTVIDEMLLVYDNGVTHIAENKNLSFISKGNLKSAYYMNDDLRLILIWRDGRLIE